MTHRGFFHRRMDDVVKIGQRMAREATLNTNIQFAVN
jgi:hypothetical protein